MRFARLVLAFIALALSPGAAPGSTCPSATWSIVPDATLPGGGSGVAELSPSNVWVVGSGGMQPAVEHWDGSTWSVTPTPMLGNGWFRKIAAIAANDLWAVGSANYQELALAEHWDGTAWTVVPTINPGTAINEFFDVAAAGPNDVWAVGGDGVGPLIEHWDGTAWSLVPAPMVPQGILFGVQAVSSTDVFVVGSDLTGALMEHWDGNGWSMASVPAGAYGFNGARAFSDTDVWVVGIDYSGTPVRALAFHFDGANWTIHTDATPPGSGNSGLERVFGTTTNDLWAVGNQFTGPGNYTSTPLIEHWDGTGWTIVPSSAFPTGGEISDITGTPDGSDLWAVEFGVQLIVGHAACEPGPTTTTTPTTSTTTTPTASTTTTTAARAPCDPTTDPDKTDIANARAAVGANCDCAGATSRRAYLSCAVHQANLTLVKKSCVGAVRRCAAHSICGKPAGAVTCCVTKATGTKCNIKRDAAHCTAPPGATACVGNYTSCCDACGSAGCATTTTTTSTTLPCGGCPAGSYCGRYYAYPVGVTQEDFPRACFPISALPCSYRAFGTGPVPTCGGECPAGMSCGAFRLGPMPRPFPPNTFFDTCACIDSTQQCLANAPFCLSVGLCPPGTACVIDPVLSCTGCGAQ